MFQVTRIKDTVETPLAFCIFCGANNVKCGEEDKDYWTVLALDLNLHFEGREDIVRALFDSWSPYDGDVPRFMDYAREMLPNGSQQSEG